MYPGPSVLRDGPAVLATFFLVGLLVFLDQNGYHRLYDWLVTAIACGGGVGLFAIALWWAFGPRK